MDDRVKEKVLQAKASFDRILDNKVYANIIKDDRHLEVLMSLVQKGRYRNILDIGTGTGYLAFPLAEVFPQARVVGIDITETVLAQNAEQARERGLKNLCFQVFDGLQYPFPEKSFDLIVSRYAFHHFPDVEGAVRQMNKLLTKGGRVLISDPMRNALDNKRIIDDFMSVKKDGHIQFYSQKELEALFEANGFGKETQVITKMKFPFARREEYLRVFESTTQKDKALYDIILEDGVVWVKHIEVGNTMFVKQ